MLSNKTKECYQQNSLIKKMLKWNDGIGYILFELSTLMDYQSMIYSLIISVNDLITKPIPIHDEGLSE